MNKKRWALLIFCLLLIAAYLKLFYKTYDNKSVPMGADYIIALDVKRITNTIIWNSITTPSQWKFGSIFKSHPAETDWKDMVEIPDYVFVFHTKEQPANVWYTVLKIKDNDGFEKGLSRYHFQKINTQEYISEGLGICIFRNQNSLLVSNAGLENKKYLEDVAGNLFEKKGYLKKETFTEIINAKSHLAIYITPNNFLQKDAIITGNFDKQTIEIKSSFTPNPQYNFLDNNFSYSSNSLCTLGFTQPPPAFYDLLSDSSKNNISKAINLNIDSVMLKSNKWYNLNIDGIYARTDSAVTYTFDDNFNKIEKVVVNNVQEPAFNFTIAGDSIFNIYNNWQSNNKLEKTVSGQLFTPMPFVKAYAENSDKELNITAANYHSKNSGKTINCVFYCNLLVTKIPADLLKYLPAKITKTLDNIESVNIVVNKNQEDIVADLRIIKKMNDLPFAGW